MRKLTDSLDSGDVAVVPAGLYGPYLPMTAGEIDWFNDLLADEIDSAFTSSIRCCDGCYDDFRARWPGTALRNDEFWSGWMSVELAVEQSRLIDIYSPAEISTLRNFVLCPRCLRYVRSEIWIHEDQAAAEFEGDIGRIDAIARRTPFLILDDVFSRKLLDQIRKLGASAIAQPLPHELFRARGRRAFGTSNPAHLPLTSFAAPPAEVVTEGRFNHAGLPMLYLADSAETALAEIGSRGEEICIASITFGATFKVLDLVEIDPDEPEEQLLAAIAASALVAAPRTGSGWVKKEYVFTRFVADCAIDAGFDFIRYGSTRSAKGTNYVMLSPPSDLSNCASLKGVAVDRLPL